VSQDRHPGADEARAAAGYMMANCRNAHG
jgi:hypothetical protein